jgi:hypothetical protein
MHPEPDPVARMSMYEKIADALYELPRSSHPLNIADYLQGAFVSRAAIIRVIGLSPLQVPSSLAAR